MYLQTFTNNIKTEKRKLELKNEMYSFIKEFYIEFKKEFNFDNWKFKSDSKYLMYEKTKKQFEIFKSKFKTEIEIIAYDEKILFRKWFKEIDFSIEIYFLTNLEKKKDFEYENKLELIDLKNFENEIKQMKFLIDEINLKIVKLKAIRNKYELYDLKLDYEITRI